jgi:hypothetical protein
MPNNVDLQQIDLVSMPEMDAAQDAKAKDSKKSK